MSRLKNLGETSQALDNNGFHQSIAGSPALENLFKTSLLMPLGYGATAMLPENHVEGGGGFCWSPGVRRFLLPLPLEPSIEMRFLGFYSLERQSVRPQTAEAVQLKG